MGTTLVLEGHHCCLYEASGVTRSPIISENCYYLSNAVFGFYSYQQGQTWFEHDIPLHILQRFCRPHCPDYLIWLDEPALCEVFNAIALSYCNSQEIQAVISGRPNTAYKKTIVQTAVALGSGQSLVSNPRFTFTNQYGQKRYSHYSRIVDGDVYQVLTTTGTLQIMADIICPKTDRAFQKTHRQFNGRVARD